MNWPMQWGLGTYVWVENDPILRWEVAFDASRKDHMWTTLSEISDLYALVEKFPKHGIWDMRGFKLNILGRERGGLYCKGPTHVKTYITFALMSNSELTEVVTFLEERIDVVQKSWMGLVRTLETLRAELEFRGLDTGYVVWLIQRAKEKGNAMHQDFMNWARRTWEEANQATREEYKTSSSEPIKMTILDSVQRETDRLLALARGFNLEMDPIELNTNLEEVESSLSEFIRGHFDSNIGTPYQIALSRSNEAQAEIAIAYFRGLIWLLLTFSEPGKVITYREELDRLWSGKSISTRQQILHDAMIAIFDDELLQHAIQMLKEKEISPIIEVPQTDTAVDLIVSPVSVDVPEQGVARNNIIRNDTPKAKPTFTAFLERHQGIILAQDGLVSMAREVLENMMEQGLSREKQQQTLDRMIENFREIFSDRLNEVIKILQSSIHPPVMSPVPTVSKTVSNPEPVERHSPVVMNDAGRRGLKLRNFLAKEARTKFFVGKREMAFIDILTEIAPSSNFALDYKARIKELNLTLKRRGLTSIPTTLMGLGSALSWGEKPYITRNDLLARYKIAIPLVSDSNKPDDQKMSNAQGTSGTIKTVKLHKKEGKKAVPIAERQRVFIQVLDMPFGTPETTLREILPGIFGVKHGFWKIFFEALWKINAILASRWIRALPTTTTGFCLFLTGETSRTRKEIEALFLSFWITIGQKSIETESPVGNDKENDKKATCDEEIRIVPIVSQSEISVVPQDPEPDIETKKSGKISGSLTKDISPFSPEEAAIIRLLIELPVSADRFAALVRYSSKHNMDRSNRKKVPESIDGWLVRAGVLWKCLAELEQFLTQILSSDGQGPQKHFARIFIEDILPELLSAGDEARALDVLRSFTKTSLSLSAEYPLTIATLYRLAGNGWDQILGHIITATTIQISVPVSVKKTSPVPKKPRVTSWEWVLQEIVTHEATFFEWLKDYFESSLPKKDKYARGFTLRALKNIAKDCLSEDPSQIMQAHITVIEGNISIHFPSALTEQLRPFESYILDLITPEANVAQQIEHSLGIVWTE